MSRYILIGRTTQLSSKADRKWTDLRLPGGDRLGKARDKARDAITRRNLSRVDIFEDGHFVERVYGGLDVSARSPGFRPLPETRKLLARAASPALDWSEVWAIYEGTHPHYHDLRQGRHYEFLLDRVALRRLIAVTKALLRSPGMALLLLEASTDVEELHALVTALQKTEDWEEVP